MSQATFPAALPEAAPHATPEAAPESTLARAPARASTAGRYIAGPGYDWAFFLAPPALALLVGLAVAHGRLDEARFWHEGRRVGHVALALGALIHAHLLAVFLRSHGNPDVRRRHPLRFFLLPPALVAAMMVSEAVAALATCLVVFWDVYHSAAQTFGFARLYDKKAGNDASAGRRLDLALNVALYVGPILAGATLLEHLAALRHLEDAGILLFSGVPALAEEGRPLLAAGVLGLGALFLAGYVASYARLARRGYRVSWQKVWLLASTGATSIVAWGFNPMGQAFLIMNAFHAVQYLGLVFFTEGARLGRSLRLGRLAALLLLPLLFAYGVLADLVVEDERLLWSVVQAVALLHFFYDGFIWSVSKRQV